MRLGTSILAVATDASTLIEHARRQAVVPANSYSVMLIHTGRGG